jgi:hypothetical protein
MVFLFEDNFGIALFQVTGVLFWYSGSQSVLHWRCKWKDDACSCCQCARNIRLVNYSISTLVFLYVHLCKSSMCSICLSHTFSLLYTNTVVEQISGNVNVLNHLSVPAACFTHPEISMVGLTEVLVDFSKHICLQFVNIAHT